MKSIFNQNCGSKKFNTQLKTTSLSRKLFASLAITSALAGVSAKANPVGGQVAAGNAQINQTNPNVTTVTETSNKALINWQSFSIGQGQLTEFIQPSSSSIIANRVVGVDPSKILGALKANGQVYLINPNGIFFSKTATVDVSGLIASTADIKNSDFMAGNRNFSIAGKPDASVINRGTITARNAGLVALVAPGVENSGIIQANMGAVVLAAGETATFDFYGDKLINFTVTSPATSKAKDENGNPLLAAVSNSGTINAAGGQVLITANAAKAIVDNVVNMNGIVDASSATVVGGSIVLNGGDAGTVNVAGSINAKGTTGGNVDVLGNEVVLASGSIIDASGINGGGKVRIGGDFHGQGPLNPAKTTTVENNAIIRNDAEENGDGGTVAIWSDEKTIFQGNVSAKGGANSGNGGFVEVSVSPTNGKGYLFDGKVDLSAAKGTVGTLLLDPDSVTIGDNPGADDGSYTGNIASGDNPGANMVISHGAVETALSTASVDIEAVNYVSVTTAIDVSGSSGAATHSLTLGADTINVNAGIALNNGDLNLNGGTAVNISTSAISLGTGNFNVHSVGGSGNTSSFTFDSASTINANSVNINADHSTISGAITAGGLVSIIGDSVAGSVLVDTGTISGAGAVDISAGTVNIASGGSVTSTGDNITLSAATATIAGSVNANSNLDISTTTSLDLNSTLSFGGILTSATGNPLVNIDSNSASINQGIALVTSLGTVSLADSTTYNQQVDINKQITLSGASQAGTVIDGGGNSPTLLIDGGGTGSIIKNLTVQNSGPTSNNIYIDPSATGVTIDHVTAQNAGNDNIYVGGDNATITGVTASGAGTANIEVGAANVSIDQSTVEGAVHGYGILNDGVTGLSITNTTFDSNQNFQYFTTGSATPADLDNLINTGGNTFKTAVVLIEPDNATLRTTGIYSKIQNAVNDAQTGAPGDIVKAYAGDYNEGQINVNTSGITIEGNNVGIAGNSHSNPETNLVNNTYFNVGANNVTIDGVQISSNGQNGVDINNNSSGVIVRNNIIQGAESGVYVSEGASGITIDSNKFVATGGGQDGVYIGSSSGSNITISNDLFDSNYRGVYIGNSVSGVTISGSTFQESGYGVYIDGASNVNVDNNTFSSNATGLYATNASTLEIGGNSFSGSESGMYFDNTGNVTIQNNTIDGTNGSGVFISNLSHDFDLEGNTFTNNQTGLDVENTAHTINVGLTSGNTFQSNGTGIYNNGQDMQLANNTFTGNTNYQLQVGESGTFVISGEGGNSASPSVFDNIVGNNNFTTATISIDTLGNTFAIYPTINLAVESAGSGYTVRAYAGDYNNEGTISINQTGMIIEGANQGIAGNGTRNPETNLVNGTFSISANGVIIDGFKFTNTGNDGVDINSGTGVIVRNSIIQGAELGVFVSEGASSVEIANNSFNNNGTGVYLSGSSGSNIHDNTFTGNYTAAYAYYSDNATFDNNTIVGGSSSETFGTGIELDHSSNAGIGVTTGNTFQYLNTGILTHNNHDVEIAQNTFTGNNVAIGAYSNTLGTNGTSIHNNEFDNNQYGFSAEGSEGVQLTNNIFSGNTTGIAMFTTVGVAGILIDNNVFNQNASTTAIALDDAAGSHVTNNTFNGESGGLGVVIGKYSSSDNVTIAHNTFNTLDTAVNVNNSQGGIVDSDLFSGNNTALSVTGGGGVTITNSVFSGNSGTGTGISVDGATSTIAFGDNFSTFTGLTNYIVFANNALSGTTLDVSNLTFDGVQGVAMSEAQTDAAKGKVTDFDNDPTLGEIAFNNGIFPPPGGGGGGGGIPLGGGGGGGSTPPGDNNGTPTPPGSGSNNNGGNNSNGAGNGNNGNGTGNGIGIGSVDHFSDDSGNNNNGAPPGPGDNHNVNLLAGPGPGPGNNNFGNLSPGALGNLAPQAGGPGGNGDASCGNAFLATGSVPAGCQ